MLKIEMTSITVRTGEVGRNIYFAKGMIQLTLTWHKINLVTKQIQTHRI
jgi:hypothetical protein